MRTRDTIRTALGGLSTHKSRSALTILGIVIGITSITLVTAIGQSAQDLILGEVQSFGPELIGVLPGKQPKGFVDASGSIMNDSIKIRDVNLLSNKANVPDAKSVTPAVFGPVILSHDSNTFSSTMLGSTSTIFEIYDLELKSGEYFNDDDVAQYSPIIVIGKKVGEELFGNEDPLGNKIKIKDKNYKIVGILDQKAASFINFNEAVFMPYTTAQQYILGIKYVQRVIVMANSVDNIDGTVKDIEATLKDSHNIEDPEDDDFFVETQADIAKTIGTVTSTLTVLLGSVAAISLVVGGVGIMNIMLVSVTERTREIGLRKAVGATNKDILYHFLSEAIILTLAGGILGILFGVTLSYLAGLILNSYFAVNLPFALPLQGIVLGIGVSTAIGFIFGIYPARRASQKSPIEALRYE